MALKPNRKYDWVGAWSGGALVKKDKENFRDPKVIRYKDHYLMVTGRK